MRDAIASLAPHSRAQIDEALATRRELGDARPVVCPLLDTTAGLCRIYDARPIACRTYGFYADRDGVLGCHRILEVAETDDAVVWGNHGGIESERRALGESRSLLSWIGSADPEVRKASTPRPPRR